MSFPKDLVFSPEVRLPTHRDETTLRHGRRLKAKPSGYLNCGTTKGEPKTESGGHSVRKRRNSPFKSQKGKNIYFTAPEFQMPQFNQSSQHNYLVSMKIIYLFRTDGSFV